jgi:hypothetical protein
MVPVASPTPTAFAVSSSGVKVWFSRTRVPEQPSAAAALHQVFYPYSSLCGTHNVPHVDALLGMQAIQDPSAQFDRVATGSPFIRARYVYVVGKSEARFILDTQEAAPMGWEELHGNIPDHSVDLEGLPVLMLQEIGGDPTRLKAHQIPAGTAVIAYRSLDNTFSVPADQKEAVFCCIALVCQAGGFALLGVDDTRVRGRVTTKPLIYVNGNAFNWQLRTTTVFSTDGGAAGSAKPSLPVFLASSLFKGLVEQRTTKDRCVASVQLQYSVCPLVVSCYGTYCWGGEYTSSIPTCNLLNIVATIKDGQL